jgi:glycerol-3-phosphate acyltransferase PlsX
VKRRTDPIEYGGAPLLGVKGCCVIGHGRSNAVAVKHGIRAAAEFYTSGVNERIEAALKGLFARKETPSLEGS